MKYDQEYLWLWFSVRCHTWPLHGRSLCQISHIPDIWTTNHCQLGSISAPSWQKEETLQRLILETKKKKERTYKTCSKQQTRIPRLHTPTQQTDPSRFWQALWDKSVHFLCKKINNRWWLVTNKEAQRLNWPFRCPAKESVSFKSKRYTLFLTLSLHYVY